jgi:hypothetical protein
MNAPALIDRLERFGPALASVVAGVPDEQARWKPPSGAWSILEIVCHLGDEEVEDFRARLFSTMEDPTRKWPLTDPESWARDRRYNEQDLAAATSRFVEERRRTVELLRALKDPDWTKAYIHPRVGPVPAGELLTSWPAHDALHLRQIAKRLFELSARDGGFKTTYAGEWGA